VWADTACGCYKPLREQPFADNPHLNFRLFSSLMGFDEERVRQHEATKSRAAQTRGPSR